jgi:hypothetical protein
LKVEERKHIDSPGFHSVSLNVESGEHRMSTMTIMLNARTELSVMSISAM